MIDVFLCTTHHDRLRETMFDLCYERWKAEPGVRVSVISPNLSKCSKDAFQRQRRIYADEHAESDIYIVADDDCLPQPGWFAEDAAALLKYYTPFRILSLMPVNATIQQWTPNDEYSAYVDTQVMEHHSVGGIRFCRKYLLSVWPPQHGLGYDSTQCEAVRRTTNRVGYFREFKMNHLGEGYSTVWGKAIWATNAG